MGDWDSGFSFGGDSGNWWDSGTNFDFDSGFSQPSYSFPDFNRQLDFNVPALPNSGFTNQGMGAGLGSGLYGGGGGYGGGWGGLFSNPQTLLGLTGGIAGLAGTLAGGGVKQQNTPKMSTPQKDQFNKAQNAAQGMSQFAQGQTPLQKMQAQLLQAIAGGKGLDQAYGRSVEQAFEPQMGNLYEQASAAGRKRGFHDAPATSPAGGAVLGPGLADLQGQIAQAKINMMMGLPGLYQNPINSQAQMAQAFSQGQGNLFSNYPTGQTISAPLGPQIGQSIGQGLIGLGSAFGQQQQQQQQNQFNQSLLGMMGRRYDTPYQFGGYSGT